MISLVTRVLEASVVVDQQTVGRIGRGLLALCALQSDDTDTDLQWTCNKLSQMRVFRTEDGTRHFERDVVAAGGSILLVSNFTLAAATRKGRRPDFTGAMPPDRAVEVFARFVERVRATGIPTETGRFGADMTVHSINDGPSTFILSSR
ncbi:MAG TPA: D-aminoacyl-tRNA deacylase [Tepidisphaeraceae bacterium]|nr:D-aminoacyl-tRNA deacylase [Tepidisphaeraceae bacterium]